MPASRSHRRARLAVLLSIVLAVTGFQFLLAPTSQANPGGTDLVITEVYVNGGSAGATHTNKYVEIYNPTGSPIALGGKSLQYRAPTSTGNSTTAIALTAGDLAPGDYWVVMGGSNGANGTAVPNVDQTATAINPGAGGGTISLVNGTAAIDPSTAPACDPIPAVGCLVDKVGWGTSNAPEGTAASGNSVTLSLQRVNSGADTNVNSADFAAAAPTAGGPKTPVGPTPLTIADITNKTGVVGQPIAGFTATASGGTAPYTFSDPGSTLPPGVSIAAGGAVSGTPTTAGSYSVVLNATDSATPTAGADTEEFTFTVDPAPVGVTPIAEIQGSGTASPLTGTVRTTEGVVTATYPVGGFNGFYLQTPGADTTPGRSDALFVFTPSFDDSTLDIGDSVQVTGTVTEFGTAPNTLTEINATTVTDVGSLGTVVANTTIPGTDCALGSCPNLATIEAAKEEVEGELFQPTGDWTVTDAYDGSSLNPTSTSATNGGSSSFFGELGLAANSTLPLIAQTEVAAPGSSAANERIAYNNAHRVILDDGSSTTYWNTANPPTLPTRNDPIPWYTPTHQVRVGASVTFPQGVILDYRFGWKIQPQGGQVVGAPTGKVTFEQDRPATPANVGGDLKLATFNVLNYFTTLGVDYDAGPESCTSFVDKDLNPIAVNSCTGNGPRGAWNNANFLRQQAKIVTAINTMDADIVSLEEIENSRKVDGIDRDEALSALVAALNADAGTTRWDYVPSPAALPAVEDEDVIRTGFIYDPATVDLVGDAQILIGSAPFANAREPFAQAFKQKGAADEDGFAVVVNHFKSKSPTGATGDNVDLGDGAGGYNGDRTRQAQALDTFADDFAASRGVSAAFLTGDFNAYSQETPVTTLTGAGWTNLESTDDPEEKSYSFDGMSGSLDHVFANADALALVNDVDIWEINANETVYNQYSRYNYVGTLLYDDGPFSASDHNPEVIGINLPDVEPATRDIQILGTNDFHGRIANDPVSAAAGAGVLAGAVNQLRGENPDTVFAAAGDLIGASTFESFILNDKPTIDALNSAGLDVSSVGNHEFDQGYADLVDRVMAPESASNPDGGAEWQYLGANVRFKANDDPALPATWTKDFGNVRVGFVGVVTEHLPELVSPGGITDIKVTDIVAETNTAADDLVDNQGADIVVMLVHEGAPNTNCATMDDDPTSDFGSIITGVDENVDAIVSGHTHLEYNCSFPVADWATEGRAVTERPVVSAGQYGAALNKLVFTVDTTTGEVLAKTQSVLRLKTCTASACGGSGQPPWVDQYPTDADTQAIVNQALSEAAVLGAVPLGEIAGPIRRGYLANGTTENRGVESSLGNLVAEAQRWQTSGDEAGGAQIAFMNPGGLRTDMLGNGASYPKTVTYKQAAEVQPFANGLVNMDLTGAQIKAALEQQWQPTGASRPFLKLGASKGFTYTSDPDAATGSHITGMWLDRVPIAPATVYSVTVNSFLSTGGDNFTSFAGGTNKAEAGLTDLQAMVNYLDEFANTGAGDPPLPVPTKQNGVHVNFPAGAPASYQPGDHVVFDVSGWSFSNATDPLDGQVAVDLDGAPLGTFTLDNTIQAALPGFDATGKTTVDVVLPAGATGAVTLTLTGPTTGTSIPVTVQVDQAASTTVADDVTVAYGQPVPVLVTVTGPGATPTGTVTLLQGSTPIGTGTLGVDGTTTITVPARTLPVGTASPVAVYGGDAGHTGSQDGLTVTTTKATSSVDAPDVNATPGAPGAATVTVTADGVTPTGTVTIRRGATTIGTATLVGGQASVNLPVLPSGTVLTAEYSGDANVTGGSDTFTVTVGKAVPTVSATDVSVKYGKTVGVTITVTAPAGLTPTGTVRVKNGGTTLASGNLSKGKVKITLPARSLLPGTHTLTAEYAGNANLAAASDTFTVTVRKATSTTQATVQPQRPRPNQAVTLTIRVDGSDNVPITGQVRIVVDGDASFATLEGGRLRLDLGRFGRGGHTVRVEYLGSTTVDGSASTVRFTVS
ncbi:MAG TPA: hypothetical protein DEQ43_20315 [Nocardioides bacterium]|nr:hypothetical protein [Nocardioides sp.]